MADDGVAPVAAAGGGARGQAGACGGEEGQGVRGEREREAWYVCVWWGRGVRSNNIQIFYSSLFPLFFLFGKINCNTCLVSPALSHTYHTLGVCVCGGGGSRGGEWWAWKRRKS